MSASSSKTLRVGDRGGEFVPVVEAASKPKAKKGFIDEDYHGFFLINNAIAKFTTYSGRRYVRLQDVVDEKFLTTIGSGLRGRDGLSIL